MNPTTKAAIEFVIDKYKLREEHDTAGDLIDALKKDGKGTAVQHLTEAMASKDYVSRSTLINNFLRDIEADTEPPITIEEGMEAFKEGAKIGQKIKKSFGSGVADIADDLKEINEHYEKEMEILGKGTLEVFLKGKIKIPNGPLPLKFPCNHYDGTFLCNERASVLLVTASDTPILFGLCAKHQRGGDMTSIPIKEVIALLWENEQPITITNLANEVRSWAGKETIASHTGPREPCGRCDNPIDSDFHREHCEGQTDKPKQEAEHRSESVGLIMKYFVLKPAGDTPYHHASRAAMLTYANLIRIENRALADEILAWANKEIKTAQERIF